MMKTSKVDDTLPSSRATIISSFSMIVMPSACMDAMLSDYQKDLILTEKRFHYKATLCKNFTDFSVNRMPAEIQPKWCGHV